MSKEKDITRTRRNTKTIKRRNVLSTVVSIQRVFLVVIGPEGEIESKDLDLKDITIGRSPECDIHLPFDDISREHCRIYYHNEEYYIEDLGSTNGTLVNNVKVEKCVLHNNDQIDLGVIKLVFHEERLWSEEE